LFQAVPEQFLHFLAWKRQSPSKLWVPSEINFDVGLLRPE
jgi:hypothetical protein